MLKNEIEVGGTYLFVATDSPKRKHLEGEAFTVWEIKKVYRSVKFGRRGRRPVMCTRFFNDDGIGAKAEELEPLPEREFPCDNCELGEMKLIGVHPSGITKYECDRCGLDKSFP